MTGGRWRSGLLLAALAAAAGAETLAIPDHPRDLRFGDGRVELPSVGDRRMESPSGAVIYLAESSTLPLVEITLALRVGAFLEPLQQTGLAFLTASQIRRGGTSIMAADDFDERLESLGAQLDTVSGTTRSGASLSVPTWALDEALDLLFQMLRQPGFQEDRLQVSRDNLLESLGRRNEDALQILEREWEWLMYGRDHFSTRAMTPATLAAVERQDLQQFHSTYWVPQQMILAVSGDFDRRRLLADLEDRLAGWPDPDPVRPAPDWPPPPPGPGRGPGLFHYEMDLPQAKVILGHRFPALLEWTDPDRFALAIVAEILGGRGAISRIAGRLRTAEGLVYRTSTEIYAGDLWPGELRIFFETRGDSVARATALALEELERLRSTAPHPLELAVVKQTLMSRLRLRFDTAEEVAGYFAEDELLGRPHRYWQQYLSGIEAVTEEDVRRIAAAYLRPGDLTMLVIGRWREIAPGDQPKLESLLGHPRIELEVRDPRTLEVRGSEEKGVAPHADRSPG